jgi:hypothetical protein
MADCRKDWRKSKNAFCLQVATHKFHNISLYTDDINELGFRTDSKRSAELMKFRTEPIPKNFYIPFRTVLKFESQFRRPLSSI